MDFGDLLTLTPEEVLRAGIRRWKQIAIITGVCTTVAAGAAFSTPPVYKATTLIYADRGKYPTDFVQVKGIIPEMEEHLGVLMKRTFVRKTYAELVERFELYDEIGEKGGKRVKGTEVTLRQASAFNKAVDWDLVKAGDARRFVEVEFIHADPELAADVANAMSEELRMQNRALRISYAEEVVTFVQRAHEEAKKEFDRIDSKRTAFREANADSLPEQETLLTNQIARLRHEQSSAERSLDAAKIQLRQVTGEARALLEELARYKGPSRKKRRAPRRRSNPAAARAQSKVDDAQAKVAALKQQYTDQHPKVRAAERELDVARSALRRAEASAPSAPAVVDAEPAPSGGRVRKPKVDLDPEDYELALEPWVRHPAGKSVGTARIRRAMREYRQSKAAVAFEEKRIKEIGTQLNETLAASERMPSVRREIDEIDEEHKAKRERFQVMVRELERARKVKSIEEGEHGEHLEIVEPAVPPQSPYGSKRGAFLFGGLIAGFVLGLVSAVLREKFARSYHASDEIERELGISVLVEIPMVRSEELRG